MLEWVRSHDVLLWWLGIGSVITFALGVFLVPLLVVRMPADFFMRHGPPADSFRGRHPVVRTVGLALRNLFGLALMLAGIAMLVLPGQGILTILLGLGLVTFPGKRKLELAIVRRGPVLRLIQWIRKRRGRAPLQLP